MHGINVAIMGSPIVYGIINLIALGMVFWILTTKREVVKATGWRIRCLVSFVILASIQLTMLQVTTPINASAIKRFDAPVVHQSDVPEKVTVGPDNVSKAQTAFEEQLNKSKQVNAQ